MHPLAIVRLDFPGVEAAVARARTPALDRLAARGRTTQLETMSDGFVAPARLAELCGVAPRDAPAGGILAVAAALEPEAGIALAVRPGWLVDYPALGATGSSEAAGWAALAEESAGAAPEGFRVFLHTLAPDVGALLLIPTSGPDLDADIEGTDPAVTRTPFGDRRTDEVAEAVRTPRPLTGAAGRTAVALQDLVEETAARVGRRRRRAGGDVPDALLTWGAAAGLDLATLRTTYGTEAALLGADPYTVGLGAALGSTVQAAEPGLAVEVVRELDLVIADLDSDAGDDDAGVRAVEGFDSDWVDAIAATRAVVAVALGRELVVAGGSLTAGSGAAFASGGATGLPLLRADQLVTFLADLAR